MDIICQAPRRNGERCPHPAKWVFIDYGRPVFTCSAHRQDKYGLEYWQRYINDDIKEEELGEEWLTSLVNAWNGYAAGRRALAQHHRREADQQDAIAINAERRAKAVLERLNDLKAAAGEARRDG
jgi:hypothetical protein